MREIRLSGSEGGVALIPPSLPLSEWQRHRAAKARRRIRVRQAYFVAFTS